LIAVLLAEALEDGAALRRRAAGEAAEGLRAVVLGNGGRHASRLAARVLADRNRGSSEGGLIGGHELGRARNAGKLDIGRAAAAEVVVAAVALHVFEMKAGHRSAQLSRQSITAFMSFMVPSPGSLLR